MDFWGEFHGPNSAYVLDLYERFLEDPSSVDEQTRQIFERWKPPSDAAPVSAPPADRSVSGVDLEKAVAVANLARAIRIYGRLAAHLDPLGSPPPGDPSLDLEFYGLTEEELRQLPASLVGGPAASAAPNAFEAIQALRYIYHGNTGYDLGQVVDPEEREWLRETVESRQFCNLDPEASRALLERLTQVDTLEKFLHRSFPGKTRFSIEGLDMMVPILDKVIQFAADDDFCMVFLGMAHRGRINVLAHILGRSYEEILAEFKDPGGDDTAWQELGWTGDVKYHRGGRRLLSDEDEVRVVVSMPPNPSHLEYINPVVEGMARAADTSADNPGMPRFFPKASLPILIHGDAAFTGEGIVAETLNLSQLDGYQTAGTIHIIANNQLGFTTLPEETRSSMFSSDYARGLRIPVIHVNADDPEACIEAACTGYAYRKKFQKDFIIDLIGYRRFGHNEGDEPSFSQPEMYQLIENHPPLRSLWASRLQERGVIEAGWADELVNRQMRELQVILDAIVLEEHRDESIPIPPPRGAARRVPTTVPIESLRELNEALMQVPEGFELNRKLERPRRRRKTILDAPGEPTIDWAAAEDLAFASILADGVPIRLTGQDTERGTFSQRHAVLHDVKTGEKFIPLQALPQAKAAYEVYNSPLSESGAVGFEFGFNIQAPERLVLWEAQYGDFVNIAQPVIDEFLLSARAKWGQTPSLVLLLPHGNEGQGPDHTSARPERFLQLAAENNFRLAFPTTASQYFHLLRRHVALLKTDPLPLIVLTPKGLLRHPLTASRPLDLAEGSWQRVIDDETADSGQVRRLVLCSGRIFVDLAGSPVRQELTDLAVARVEQLYPFAQEELSELFEKYAQLEEVIWTQEEPQNLGFWDFMRPRLIELIAGRWPLRYVGRRTSSSPAEGSGAWYASNQKTLIEQVFSDEKESLVEKGVVVEEVNV
ncbi:MAG: 2-oxoglutarate dehydrogenase E1 component [Chloroflexi bacterium]|nr:MAG: 2-oxoglutarate dehydrogenase E1 component [Chloroflexota bacterium]